MYLTVTCFMLVLYIEMSGYETAAFYGRNYVSYSRRENAASIVDHDSINYKRS